MNHGTDEGGESQSGIPGEEVLEGPGGGGSLVSRYGDMKWEIMRERMTSLALLWPQPGQQAQTK